MPFFPVEKKIYYVYYLLMNKLKKLFLLTLCFLSFVSCEKKVSEEVVVQEPEVNVEPYISSNIKDIPLWIPGNYPKIAIAFGHGYEDETVRNQVVAVLESQFGLAENGGLIIPLAFPEVYFNNKKVSADWLRKAIQNQDVFAIITVSAPEKTHYSLADLQDNGVSAKVYSVFSQDNELGTESGSEFVLNYKSLGARLDSSDVYVLDENKDISTSVTRNYEEEGMFQGDITEILIPIISRIKAVNNQAIPETPVSFAAYLEEAYEENFPDSTLTPYVDAQTGIKSLNHYVLGVYDE